MAVGPLSSQIWPPVVPRTLERQVWDSTTAKGLPGVGMALTIYRGLISSCALQLTRGYDVLPTPRMLDRPDPDVDRPTWIGDHVEDYLLHGNALHLVTVRGTDGYPLAARWYPAQAWTVEEDQRTGEPVYRLYGRDVDRDDVVHVRRGTDPTCRWRGIGVVEQHLRTLNRAGLEEAAESENLTNRGRPDVVVITNMNEPDPDELDKAADKWVERFGGQDPKPAFLPAGSSVVPLSWNPTDGQMVEARKMTTKDVAQLLGLDPYWLGAEGSSHTYKSPGPLFLTLVKLSLGPVMDPFEDVWSNAWLPGRAARVRFDRARLLVDDLGSMLQAFSVGSAYFPDKNEVRTYMGFPPLPDDAFPKPPVIPPAAPADDQPADTADDQPAEDTQEVPA